MRYQREQYRLSIEVIYESRLKIQETRDTVEVNERDPNCARLAGPTSPNDLRKKIAHKYSAVSIRSHRQIKT